MKSEFMLRAIELANRSDSDVPVGAVIVKDNEIIAEAFNEREKNRNINLRVHQWTIVAYPGKDWANTIFPNLEENNAVEEVWK